MQNTLQIDKGIGTTAKSDTTTPTLLIIDDDESLRKVMAFRLKNSYKIIDSGSPEEALALALQHKPDAILLDLMMPKYSGFEVCQTLFSKAGRHRRVTKETNQPDRYQSRWPAEKAPRSLEGNAEASRD